MDRNKILEVNDRLCCAIAKLMVPGEPSADWCEGRMEVINAQNILAEIISEE